MKKEITFLWSDYDLCIFPEVPGMKEELFTFYRKELDVVTGNYDFEKEEAYNVLNENGAVPIIQTYPGFYDMAIMYAVKAGYKLKLVDRRKEFPKPRWDLTYGFRLNQEQLLRQGLGADRAGLIEAPTRYGKTTLIINTLRAFPGLKTIVTAPGKELIRQTYDDIVSKCPGREVGMLVSGAKRNCSEDITVASMDSLHHADFEGTRLILIDEPHSMVTTNRVPIINRFHNARKIGYGATLEGRADNTDLLIKGIMGPKLAVRTYTEAVKEGAVCMIHVLALEVELRGKLDYIDRRVAYDELVFNNPNIHTLIKNISETCIPEDKQTLIFIKHEKQADAIHKALGFSDSVVAMAKKLSNKERKEINSLMVDGVIKRCIASDIYSTGITFSQLMYMISMSGGGKNIGAVQKPGRLAEIRPGKRCGVLIDFIFKAPKETAYGKGTTGIINDSKNRLSVYRQKGYTVHKVKTLKEIKEMVDKLS